MSHILAEVDRELAMVPEAHMDEEYRIEVSQLEGRLKKQHEGVTNNPKPEISHLNLTLKAIIDFDTGSQH